MSSRMMTGSYFDNHGTPRVGDTVWALIGQVTRKPAKGAVASVEQTYYGKHAYCDVVIDGRTYRTGTDTIFDHKPKQVEARDEYGAMKRWE